MWLAVTILVAVLSIGITVSVLQLLRRKDGHWHQMFLSPRRMARFVSGKWQYRDMTDNESREDIDARTW